MPLRWFTPTVEVDLCGHATLAAAHVLFRYTFPSAKRLTFETRSGNLTVTREGDLLAMDFPSRPGKPVEITDSVVSALGPDVRQTEASVDSDANRFNSSTTERRRRRGVSARAPGHFAGSSLLPFIFTKRVCPVHARGGGGLGAKCEQRAAMSCYVTVVARRCASKRFLRISGLEC